MNRGGADSVAERRLRHVYDNLDAGYYKKAISEADKVLKKHPDTLGAKALKGLALIRLGRESEAWKSLEEVEEAGPNQDHVMTALTHAFKELGRGDRVAALYQVRKND